MNPEGKLQEPWMGAKPNVAIIIFVSNPSEFIILFTSVVLMFLFSLPISNMFLSKIPKAMVNGSPSMIGNAIKALLAGAIFFVVSKFV